ncbi:MAG TPA: type VI secretion system ATPase ClpV, partial [Chryseobacterium sp.]|nr:type VI secretion system ATPase ClpV [Chryseobacterium sp.]
MSVLITNETVKELFHIAQSLARENYNSTFGAPHLLQALMHNNIGLKDFLVTLGKDPAYIYEWSEVRIEEYPKSGRMVQEPEPDDAIDDILEEADEVRIKLGLDEISALCILTAVTKSGVAFSAQELKSLPVREHEILNYYRG